MNRSDMTHEQLQSLVLAIVSFLKVAYEGVPVDVIIANMAENIHASSKQDGPEGTQENAEPTP